MAVNIEDAGFEIRDMIAWVYGSGFPKSRDISKDMDRMAGAEREVIGTITAPGMARTNVDQGAQNRNVYTFDKLGGPVTNAAQQWEGWGTALKPALEPITVARKPFKGTVAANVLEHGTGALNIDGCRVGTGEDEGVWPVTQRRHNDVAWTVQPVETDTTKGRWPANLIHDGSEQPTALLRDSARFFYTAKASKDDRDKGNTHPTVKPTDLMAYLCRLVTPPGGIVLDPFMGSGTTGKAALSEGFQFIGIERDPDYYAICESRFNGAQIGLPLAL